MMKVNAETITAVLIIILVVVTYLAGEYRSRERDASLEDKITLLKYTEIEDLTNRVQGLQLANLELKGQIRELWFSGMNSEVVLGIIGGKKVNCPLETNRVYVTNTFYSKVPYEPAGYLIYVYRQGALLFDKNGNTTCFDGNATLIACDKLCKGVTDEKAAFGQLPP